MEGIEKITAKILQDCEDQVRQLQEETEAKVRTLEAAARTQADRESADILARGRRAADERLERLKSAAQMERRKLELAAKQEVLGEAFDLALEKLDVYKRQGLRRGVGFGHEPDHLCRLGPVSGGVSAGGRRIPGTGGLSDADD